MHGKLWVRHFMMLWVPVGPLVKTIGFMVETSVFVWLTAQRKLKDKIITS